MIIFYGKCEACRKSAFFIRNRTLVLPIGKKAKSQKKICRTCYKSAKTVIK